MREKVSHILEGFRDTNPEWGGEGHHGVFFITRCGITLLCVSSGIDPSNPDHWEHVSVSVVRKNKKGYTKVDRTPTWGEMAFVKNLFWGPEETVIQFHPPESEYVNNHEHCLHLWKPPYEVKTPPTAMIGVK